MAANLKWFLLLLYFLEAAGDKNDCIHDAKMFCPNEIKVRWWSIPPYIYKNNEIGTNIQGILPAVFQKMVASCCDKCAKVSYADQAKSEEEIFSMMSKNDSFVGFPIYGSMMQNKIGRDSYLPIVESPGILYFINTDKDLESFVEYALLNSIKSAWPIMGFIYLAAAGSGILMWALDCYWNPYQFPVQFFKGAWDGFWWACVSMTTVGYGDRAPKSIHARIFAFLWVLIGVVAVAIFHAAMTTQLTSLSMTSNPLYSGEKIVAVSGTAERKVATALNVQVSGVKDIYELRDSLTSKASIKGALLDTYVSGYYRNIFSPENGFRIADFIDKTPAYGLVLHGSEYDTPWLKRCFVRYLSLEQGEVVRTIQSLTSSIQSPKRSIQQERSSKLIDYRHGWYMWAVAVCVGFIVVFFLCGFVHKYVQHCIHLRKKKKAGKQKKYSKQVEDFVDEPKELTMEELLQRQCMELELAMEEEVNAFMTAWIDKKRMIQRCYATKS